MQQRQLRLGDILDDYCPRERRLTNHAVVAMIGDEVKQTRCTTCESDHEYKHARVPRQRKKAEPAALSAQMPVAPKRVVHDTPASADVESVQPPSMAAELPEQAPAQAVPTRDGSTAPGDVSTDERSEPAEEGPVHRPLIRAQLPRQEGQPPAARPAPDFTIRQPRGRQNRFRPRHPHAGQSFHGNRAGSNIAGNHRGGGSRPSGGRPPTMSRLSKHQGHGRKRSK